MTESVAEAMHAVFIVYGGKPSEEREVSYLAELRAKAVCTACLLAGLADAKAAFERMPALKQLLGAYWAHHSRHQLDLPAKDTAAYTGPIGRATPPCDDPPEVGR